MTNEEKFALMVQLLHITHMWQQHPKLEELFWRLVAELYPS